MIQHLRAVCTNCNEGLQNTALPKPDQIHLLAQISRATINDQEAVLSWLLQKFNLQAQEKEIIKTDCYVYFAKIFNSSISSVSETVRKSIKTLSSKIRVITGGFDNLKFCSKFAAEISLCFSASKVVTG